VLRVLIADDDERLRADFQTLLEFEPDMDVVAEADNGNSAIELSARFRPDVVVMDVRMPHLDGIAATGEIRRATPSPPAVLVVTTFDLDEYVLGAVRAGAAGFLLKESAPDLLAEAVRTVASGEGIVAPRATARLLRELAGGPFLNIQHPLTAREVHLVSLMAKGLSNEELANEAFISRSTVKTHISNILLKLGMTSRIQIVVWAYEHGFVNPGASRSP
jgi:DNA-binding NarL/FixJ family response regulator